MSRVKATPVTEQSAETAPMTVENTVQSADELQFTSDMEGQNVLATYGLTDTSQQASVQPYPGSFYGAYPVNTTTTYTGYGTSPGLTDTIGSMGTAVTQETSAPDAISVYYKDANGNVSGKQYLTAPQITAIRNFAKNKRDVSDQSGFKLKITRNNSDEPSEKYYDSSFWGSTYYRNGDETKTPVSFDKTAYTLSESQYEACLESIKDLDKQRGVIDHDLITASQKIKSPEKPFLVETGEWIQRNLFETIADFMPIDLLKTVIKMIGNVFTGLLKTLGYTFSGDFSNAGSEGLTWLKDTAIIGGSAIGIYQLGKKFEWWGKKKENSSTSNETLTNASNEANSNVSDSNTADSNTADSSTSSLTNQNLITTVSVRHTPKETSLDSSTDSVQNLHSILKQNGTVRPDNENGTIISVQLNKTNS